jgi:uncharacterized membrane protein
MTCIREAEQAKIDRDLQQILDVLKENGPMRPYEIRRRCGMSNAKWKARLARLRALGLIEPEMKETILKTGTGRYVLSLDLSP